jgi:hypothetical protein
MMKLDVPDLCARLDRIKVFCERLEELQNHETKYRDLVERIRSEADAFRQTLGAEQSEVRV